MHCNCKLTWFKYCTHAIYRYYAVSSWLHRHTKEKEGNIHEKRADREKTIKKMHISDSDTYACHDLVKPQIWPGANMSATAASSQNEWYKPTDEGITGCIAQVFTSVNNSTQFVLCSFESPRTTEHTHSADQLVWQVHETLFKPNLHYIWFVVHEFCTANLRLV